MKRVYKIIGWYQGQREIIDTFEIDQREEAKRCLSEYRMAFGQGWSLKLKIGREED
jgi:hypothetical protein